jgi:hypothetical protein
MAWRLARMIPAAQLSSADMTGLLRGADAEPGFSNERVQDRCGAIGTTKAVTGALSLAKQAPADLAQGITSSVGFPCGVQLSH